MEKVKNILKNKKAATAIVAALLVVSVSSGAIDVETSGKIQAAADAILAIFAE